MTFEYGEKEIEYLKSRDKRLASAIERIGFIRREIHPDLFSCVVRNIAGQQVSGSAAQAIWRRLRDCLKGDVSPLAIVSTDASALRTCGLSMRKVEYVKDFAAKVASGEFDIDALSGLPDAEVIAALSSLKGIGTWTAEMLLLFSLGRPDVLSFGDFGIQRGMRMVYRHRKITKQLFEKYRRRLSPYGSVASLYFWEVAGGALDGLTDPGSRVGGVRIVEQTAARAHNS